MSEMIWRKSSRSGGGAGNNCVEVGRPADESFIAVRDTKDREGGTLAVTPESWSAFLATIR